ncbi:Uncharacterized protein SCF082_LOCUS42631 [Durusdinium trenchii]|uniref:Uncharacterized protein n=1 Tax=Durusdinium trenchii TaxID=1381693 RepID=A0ABP0QS14_9DINO
MGPTELDVFFRRMFSLRVPKVIILLTLLVSWMPDQGDVKTEIQVIEYFAGVGRIARMAHAVGLQSTAVDLEYGKEKARVSGRRNSMDLNSNAGLVLAIKLILRAKFNDLVAVFAMCCSSFVPVNRGTGSRDLLVPEGDENVVSVRRSNKLLSRTVILMVLAICAGGTIIMENPQNSLVATQGRFAWLVELLSGQNISMYKIQFWMRKHLALTWKRTWVWSSSRRIRALDLGPMTASERSCSVQTTKRYKKEGKQKWHGTKALKQTQEYTYRYARNIVQLFPDMVDMDKSLLDLFMEANYDEFWDESSDLRDALLYCRGSSRICIPHEWRAALPTHL